MSLPTMSFTIRSIRSKEVFKKVFKEVIKGSLVTAQLNLGAGWAGGTGGIRVTRGTGGAGGGGATPSIWVSTRAVQGT